MKKSNIKYVTKISLAKVDKQDSLLIYDKILLKQRNTKLWIKKFQNTYAVSSGEKLKSLSEFERHLKIISKKWPKLTRQTTVYAMGGGSVGDFAGFFASVYKRGLPLVQIPTTWLAAIDSAHGGKTGLNLAGHKNQIGTFYPAQEIIVAKDILQNQPTQRLKESMGEIFKISLIDGGSLWKSFSKIQKIDNQKIIKILPQIIEAKWKVILQDPIEKKNIRHVLNLGHSIGHIVESRLRWSHGDSIFYGTIFDLILSLRLGILSEKEFLKITAFSEFQNLFDVKKYLKFLSLPKSVMQKDLMSDKKSSNDRFIYHSFVKNPGHILLKKIPQKILVDEYLRQQKRVKFEKR